MPPIPSSRRHLPALATYALLATWFCRPVLADPTHLALGHPGNDVWNHLWGYQWVADELLAGRLPIWTDRLGWPLGGALWFIDAFDAALTLPVTALAGPVAAYDAGIWFNLWLCGAGAYLLALRVTGSLPGAWLAGFAFATTPQLLGQAYNGITETLAAGWLPLTVLAMRDAFRDPSPRRAAAAGAIWAVGTVANFYYGVFAGVFLAGMAVPAVIRAARARHRPWLRWLAAASAGGLAFAVLAGPVFALFSSTMSAEDALVHRDEGFVWKTLIQHNMMDALALVHPGSFHSPDLKVVFDEDLLVVATLGHTILWPALAAGLLARPRGVARPWLLGAAGFALLSLGPFLYVAGDYLRVAGGWLPLPFLLLFKAFPLFSRISHAYRFVVAVSLCLSVLLAWTVRAARQRGWDVPILVAGVATLRLLETCYASAAVYPLPTSRVDVPAVTARLTGGAVLDVPVGLPILARSRYLVAQFVHGQPVPYGLNDPTPPVLYHNRYTRYLLELEQSPLTIFPDAYPALDVELGRAALVDAGLRWIVVHEDLYSPAQLARVTTYLDLTATAFAHEDGLRVYRLDPAIAGVLSAATTGSTAASPTSALPAAVR